MVMMQGDKMDMLEVAHMVAGKCVVKNLRMKKATFNVEDYDRVLFSRLSTGLGA